MKCNCRCRICKTVPTFQATDLIIEDAEKEDAGGLMTQTTAVTKLDRHAMQMQGDSRIHSQHH
jgi:hypothetical protein